MGETRIPMEPKIDWAKWKRWETKPADEYDEEFFAVEEIMDDTGRRFHIYRTGPLRVVRMSASCAMPNSPRPRRRPPTRVRLAVRLPSSFSHPTSRMPT